MTPTFFYTKLTRLVGIVIVFGLGLFFGVYKPVSLWIPSDHRAAEFLQQHIAPCESIEDRVPYVMCAHRAIEESITHFSLSALLTALTSIQKHPESTPTLVYRCHDVAHMMGAADVRKEGNIQKTIHACSDVCDSGCYHGAFEGYSSMGKSFESAMVGLCEEYEDDKRKYACSHGVGHAIAAMTSTDIDKALQYCDRFREDVRAFCASGVFMEVYAPGNVFHDTALLPADHPSWCYQMNAPYDEVCFNRAGTYAYLQSSTIEKGVDACMRAPLVYQGACIGQIAKNLFFVAPLSIELRAQGIDFCSRFAKDMLFDSCVSEFVDESNI
jgi:hypothetical protein